MKDFTVELTFPNLKAVKWNLLGPGLERALPSLQRLKVKSLELKDGSVNLKIRGELNDLLRIAENLFGLTAGGGIEAMISWDPDEALVLRNGFIEDPSIGDYARGFF